MAKKEKTNFSLNGKKTVLLVEDQRYNLIVLQKMLENLGIDVVVAGNGLEAVDISRGKVKFDLILMDLKMPVMDGFHAMVEIKKIRPGIKVIAETAYAMFGDEKKIIDAGFDDYLPKPITMDSLESALRKNLL